MKKEYGSPELEKLALEDEDLERVSGGAEEDGGSAGNSDIEGLGNAGNSDIEGRGRGGGCDLRVEGKPFADDPRGASPRLRRQRPPAPAHLPADDLLLRHAA